MKRISIFICFILAFFSLSACGEVTELQVTPETPIEEPEENNSDTDNQENDDMNKTEFNLKVKVGSQELSCRQTM